MKKPQRIRPVVCVWTEDGTFVPLPRFRKLCDAQFDIHGEYPLIPSEERSMSQHRAYFAQVNECFKNLPHEYDGQYPSADHLRSWALVQTGYCSETDYPMDSEKAARRLAIDLRRMNPYSIIKVSGAVVKHFEPESQATRAMGKEKFEASCRAVLELLISMVGAKPAELRKNAGRAA